LPTVTASALQSLLLVGTFGDPQAEVSMTVFGERSVCCEAQTVWGSTAFALAGGYIRCLHGEVAETGPWR
jgi:hypothetical protein